MEPFKREPWPVIRPPGTPEHGPRVREPQITLAINRRAVPTDELKLPFKLTAFQDGETYHWQVSSVLSTITDGTNGSNLSIANLDTDNAYSATKWIVVQATVTDLAVGSLSVTAVDDPDEVGLDSSTPPEQNTIRLLIGKVSIVEDAPVSEQFRFDAARLTYGFLNGILVRVFESCHVHPSYAPTSPEP